MGVFQLLTCQSFIRSVFLATKHAAKAMLQTSPSKSQPSGSIIATASVAGLRSNAGPSTFSLLPSRHYFIPPYHFSSQLTSSLGSRLLRLQSGRHLPNANDMLSTRRHHDPMQRHLPRADRDRNDIADVREGTGTGDDWESRAAEPDTPGRGRRRGRSRCPFPRQRRG